MEFSQQPSNNGDTKSVKRQDGNDVELLRRLFQPLDDDKGETQESRKMTSFFQISSEADYEASTNQGSTSELLNSPDKTPQEPEQHDTTISIDRRPPWGSYVPKRADHKTSELMNSVEPTEDDTIHRQECTHELFPINSKSCVRLLHDDEVNCDVKTTPGAKMLLGLFHAPTGNDSPDRLRWVGTSSHTQATPERNNTKTGQHLMDLFSESSLVPPLVECASPNDQCLKSSKVSSVPDHTTISYQPQTTPLLGGASSVLRESAATHHDNSCNHNNKRLYNSIPSMAPPPMEPILEDFTVSRHVHIQNMVFTFAEQYLKVGTFLGGFIFLLYHIVFCLAMGSTISAGNLGIMAKMAASGIIFVSPFYIHFLGDEIPSQYPTTDLFLAPFMAKLALIVNETLSEDEHFTDTDHVVFLSTFSFLTSIGTLGSGLLIMLATTFKLANLGSFLPFPVLCGFFSAVGVLLWTLALGVDTGGKTVAQIFVSFDAFCNALVHHAPSLMAGTIIKIFGPSNPFFSTYIIAGTIILTYTVMFLTGTSLAEAKEAGWFWTHHDLLPPPDTGQWLPPAPFGVLFGMRHVHWGAVCNGLKTTAALSFLYLLRCSLHATALKKNVSNLKRAEMQSVIVTATKNSREAIHHHHRRWTEDVDIEAIQNSNKEDSTLKTNTVIVSAQIPTVPLQQVLIQYGWVQFAAAALGSFSVTPAIAAMDTMYKLGAEGRAPQYMSLLLLLAFYVTDFRLVAYIPKTSFSCLIVVSCLDMIMTWFIESYTKTMEKAEWLVVPIIVVCSFVFGLLNSVFVGIAISTFIFVAAFFRSGVVKYLANGLSIRSTIERSFDASEWLDHHGDKIQVMVLQNYLFFGNASSVLTYVSSMFEDLPPSDELVEYDLPPLPKYLVLDLTLVTGMDTSTVGIFNDIKTVCRNNGAKLFVSGLSIPLRATLALGNFKPEGGERSKRTVRFFAALDSAIGKAEDCLLDDEMFNAESTSVGVVEVQDEAASFEQALRAIDEQHSMGFGFDLMDLFEYTSPIELERGEHLYACEGGRVPDSDRGLSFIASGLLKIERDSNMSLARNSRKADTCNSFAVWKNNQSLSNLRARGGTIGKQAALLKASPHGLGVSPFVRLARVGPGWIAGTLEQVDASQLTNYHVAVSKCKIHHLPYHKIEQIQWKDPTLVLRLYKVLAHLTAKRQEITIGQLMTLHSIMTSPAPGKPMRRTTNHSSTNFARSSAIS